MTALLRRCLYVCVIALPLLVVAFAVIMAGSGLLATMGDTNGASALRWLGFGLASLFFVAAIGLLFILGWLKLQEFEDE